MRCAGHLAVRLANGLRRRLVVALFRAQWSFLSSRPLGDYATALTREADATVNAFLQLAVLGATSCLALVYLGVLLVVSWQGLLLSLTGIALSLLLFRPLIRYSRTVAQQTVTLQKGLVRDLVDVVPEIRSIKAMSLERHFEPVLRHKTGELEAAERRRTTANSVMPSMFEPFLTLIIVVGFLLGSSVFGYGLAELSIMAFSLWRASWQVQLAQQAHRIMVSQEPFFWSISKLIESAEQASEQQTGTLPVPGGPVGLHLDGISFAYGSAPVLNGLNMLIPAGRITALSGPSGSGKSTLIDIILGLSRPDAGRVLINEQDLAALSLSEWRSSIGYVSQRTTLLHDSVFQNVAMGDPAVDRDAARRALAAAGAWEFVSAMPHGMDSMCGEAGSSISGGQAQRIAIARALARRPRLLILDEATTALDPATERAVIQDLVALRGETTILAVSHQTAIEEVADVVYALNRGQALPSHGNAGVAWGRVG
jgi:ATP-binding cassette subfamily C protein